MLRADTEHGVDCIEAVPEGHVVRIEEGPGGLRQELIGKGPWKARRGWRLVSERRSAIDERVDAVRDLRTRLEASIVPMLRAGSLPQPLAWTAVLADDLLDSTSVEAALTALRPDVGREHRRLGPSVDLEHDAICASIRKVLREEPNGLMLKLLVARCGGETKRTTIKTRLKLMKDEIVQTGKNGAYRLRRD